MQVGSFASLTSVNNPGSNLQDSRPEKHRTNEELHDD